MELLFIRKSIIPWIEATVFGLGSGIGWFLAIVGIAIEKIRYSNVPPV